MGDVPRRSRGTAVARIDRAAGGLAVDLAFYAVCAAFAAVTAAWSSLAPHRAWGGVAWIGYAVCAVLTAGQLLARRLGRPGWSAGPTGRAGLAAVAWLATAALPLLLQALARAQGRADRAQEEVTVIEDGGVRLLDTGTPYLDRPAIAGLDEPLLGYLPYQPAMSAFGLPRALDPGAHWWSDARVGFALVTAAAMGLALVLLRRAGADPAGLVRGVQAIALLPLATLTLATGGDDLPVLALCLLALAFAATGRMGGCGAAAGAAAALKLFAWPVALVLAVHAATRGRTALRNFVVALLLLPVLTTIPAALLDVAALVENVLVFPFGAGLVTSPAASPLPGHLLATAVPGGRSLALGLLLATGAGFGVVLLRRPPRTAAAASVVCGAGLLAATLLLPATRFGYLLYPAAFLLWSGALRVGGSATSPAGAQEASLAGGQTAA